jgi:hypothetical protein
MRSLLTEEEPANEYLLDGASRVVESPTERHKQAQKKACTARTRTQKPALSSSRRQLLQRKATSAAILPAVASSKKLHSESLSYRSAAIKPIYLIEYNYLDTARSAIHTNQNLNQNLN